MTQGLNSYKRLVSTRVQEEWLYEKQIVCVLCVTQRRLKVERGALFLICKAGYYCQCQSLVHSSCPIDMGERSSPSCWGSIFKSFTNSGLLPNFIISPLCKMTAEAVNPGDLGSVPRTYIVEWESWLLQVVLWCLHAHTL